MRSQEIIFRDDDIGFAHTAHAGEIVMDSEKIFNDFTRIDKLFIKYGVTHTIAVITKDLHKAVPLVNYIKAHPHIDVQLHCHEHYDFTTLSRMNILTQLDVGCKILFREFNKEVDTFYPPYNKVDEDVFAIAEKCNLKVSYIKTDLEGYLKGRPHDVINFHYWADECKDLEAALKKYTGK